MTPEQIKHRPGTCGFEGRYDDEVASWIIRETIEQARADLIAEMQPVAWITPRGQLRNAAPVLTGEIPSGWEPLARIPKE